MIIKIKQKTSQISPSLESNLETFDHVKCSIQSIKLDCFGTDALRRVSYHFINSEHPNQYPILPKKQLPTMEFIPQIRNVLVLIIIRQNFGHAEWHIRPQYVISFCLRLYIRLDILYYYITSDTNHNYETDHHLKKLLGLQRLCIKHSNLTTMWQ